MTANEFYQPAFIGGVIRGVQFNISNNGNSTVTALSRNGVYYVYQGQKFKLLDVGGTQISAGSFMCISKEMHDLTAIPTSDIKLMVDTAGLEDCTVEALIMWGV